MPRAPQPTPPPKPERTRQERYAYALEYHAHLLKEMRQRVEEQVRAIRYLGAKLQDPARTPFDLLRDLSWSKDEFRELGRAQVLTELLGALDAGVSARMIVAHCEREALRRAESPPQSTSPTSNLAEQYLCAAWAEAARPGWSQLPIDGLVRTEQEIASLAFEMEAGLV